MHTYLTCVKRVIKTTIMVLLTNHNRCPISPNHRNLIFKFFAINLPTQSKSNKDAQTSIQFRISSKKSKTNTKKLISPLLTRPQGCQGCLKMPQDLLNMPYEVWCAKIAPKLKNIQKCLRKQGFFDIFCSNLKFFKVCAFYEQSQRTKPHIPCLRDPGASLDTPGTPGGASIVE